MPHGGQSSFPVHVALPGQVSWEIATSHPAIVRGKGQWLHHTETLCQVPGASWKQKGAGRSREGDLRLGVSRGAGVSQALPMPLLLRFRPGPHLYRLWTGLPADGGGPCRSGMSPTLPLVCWMTPGQVPSSLCTLVSSFIKWKN